MVKLISEFKQRGFSIATIKHHSHPGFEIDVPGKDTWKHAQAGSDHVIIAAPDKIASIRRLKRELTLDEIAEGITDVDLILTEGFKMAGKPALEVVRAERGLELVADSDQLIAVATDTPLDIPMPQFDLNNSKGIVDFLIKTFLLERRAV